jgi:hypothetical protein
MGIVTSQDFYLRKKVQTGGYVSNPEATFGTAIQYSWMKMLSAKSSLEYLFST